MHVRAGFHDLRRGTPGTTTVTTKYRHRWDWIPTGITFFQSLIISWFVILFIGINGISPSQRLIVGVGILFLLIIPMFLVIEGFRYSTPTIGFLVPLLLYTLVFPLFDSLFFDVNRFLDPFVIIPSVIGGIGFGLIGVASYHMKKSIFNAFLWAMVGTTLIFLSSPSILQAFLFVLSGNPSFFGPGRYEIINAPLLLIRMRELGLIAAAMPALSVIFPAVSVVRNHAGILKRCLYGLLIAGPLR